MHKDRAGAGGKKSRKVMITLVLMEYFCSHPKG